MHTTADDRAAQERLAQTAAVVAKELGYVVAEYPHASARILYHPTRGDRILLWLNAYMGRIEISGRYESMQPSVKISVAWDRDGAAVVREIERRLLPAHMDTAARDAEITRKQREEREATERTVTAIIGLVSALGAKAGRCTDANEVVIYGVQHEYARLYVIGDRADIKTLDGLDIKRVLDVLRVAFAQAPDGKED